MHIYPVTYILKHFVFRNFEMWEMEKSFSEIFSWISLDSCLEKC